MKYVSILYPNLTVSNAGKEYKFVDGVFETDDEDAIKLLDTVSTVQRAEEDTKEPEAPTVDPEQPLDEPEEAKEEKPTAKKAGK